MPKLAGRAIRIAYDSGGVDGAVELTGSTSDNFEITKNGITITDKDAAGVQTFVDDAVGSWAMSGGVEGFISDTTILLLANSTSQFTYDMEVAVGGLGTYTGKFGLTNFSVTGAEGEEAAQYSLTLVSSGTIAFS